MYIGPQSTVRHLLRSSGENYTICRLCRSTAFLCIHWSIGNTGNQIEHRRGNENGYGQTDSERWVPGVWWTCLQTTELESPQIHPLSNRTARSVSIANTLPRAESLRRIQREKGYCTSAVHGRIIHDSRHRTLYCEINLSVQKERDNDLRRKCNGTQYQETHVTTGAHTLKINPPHWYRYSTRSSRKENWEDWAVSSAVGSRYTLPSLSLHSRKRLHPFPYDRRQVCQILLHTGGMYQPGWACGKRTPCAHPVWRPASNKTPVSDSIGSRSFPWGPGSCQWVGRPSVSALPVSGGKSRSPESRISGDGCMEKSCEPGLAGMSFLRKDRPSGRVVVSRRLA